MNHKKIFKYIFGTWGFFLIFLYLLVYLSSSERIITKYIQENLNDPDSFKLRSYEKDFELTNHGCGKVYMVKYSAANAFGGIITNEEFVIITPGGKTMFSKYSKCLISKISEND